VTAPLLPKLYERDIDVVLQEELIFNEAVRELFARRVGVNGSILINQCSLSVVDNSGETDIHARFSHGDAHGVLLIENKIDAAFQPRQPERYAERAAALTKSLGCKVYSILVAPESYTRSGHELFSKFDGVISYEDISAAISSEETPRSKHRSKLMDHAINLARKSYMLIPSEEVTAMWARVYAIAAESYPDLKMSPPKEKGSGSIWIVFKAGLPANITIDWKITKSVVDLSFWPSASQKPIAGLDLTQLGASNDKAGDTVLIRIPISDPPAKWIELTDEQIHEALSAAMRLLSFYRSNPTSFA